MKNLLVIGYVWPEPTASAAGSRMLQLLHFFLAENYNITFATTASQSQHAFDLKSLGIETAKIELNNTSFDDFLKKIQPKIVLFDRFMIEEQYGWRVDVICPEAIKILDTEDLHFLRNARKKALRTHLRASPTPRAPPGRHSGGGTRAHRSSPLGRPGGG